MQQGVSMIRQSCQFLFDLAARVMISSQQIFSKIDARHQVILPGVYLGFQTLMIVHEQLNPGHVSRLLRGVHLADHVVHPNHKCSDHVEESEQITGVLQLGPPGVAQRLKVVPRGDHLSLAIRYLPSLVPRVTRLQLGGLLLYLGHLALQRGQILHEIGVFPLQG